MITEQERRQKMTKERFIKVQESRGYAVEVLGNVVILRDGNYSATWFFNADGSLDEDNKPIWSIK